MPNENALDLPKSQNNSLSMRKMTFFIPKSKGAKEGKSSKKQHDDGRDPKHRSSESRSNVAQARPVAIARSNHGPNGVLSPNGMLSPAGNYYCTYEVLYTYIDPTPEPLYATIPDTPTTSTNDTENGLISNAHIRSPRVNAIPSMTSPPPTYDVATAKTWQSGLPPTYEEYLRHKHAMLSRSHTPPPPWSDTNPSMTTMTTSTKSTVKLRRDLRGSQPDLRAIAQNKEQILHYHPRQGATVAREISGCPSSQQRLREQQVRSQQRARAMPPRSHSESRAQQQRAATMYEDGAFCMETAVLQSAFEHGVAFCSLM